MNGLDPATVVMVCLLAVVATGVIGTFLGSVLWALFGDLVLGALAPVGRLGRRVLGFLERAVRDIVAGLLNAVEWLVYGRGGADVSRLFG